MTNCVDERITDEIEALEAILLDDVTIHSNNGVPYMIETVVHPSTADDTDQQYVCVTLEVTLSPGYPDVSPTVKLRNPRGLDDAVLESITTQVQDKILDCLGQPAVFELIELIRENLTNSNLPSGQCVICLYGFVTGDVFIKTPCYHHFHNYCLSKHLVAGEKNYNEELDKLPLWQRQQAKPYQPTCPVCREVISCDADALGRAPPPYELTAARGFELTVELQALQRHMEALYQKQRSRGGIIDHEADNSRLLLLTGDGTTTPKSNSPSDESPTEENAISRDTSRQNDSTNTAATVGSTSCSPQATGGNFRGPYRGFNRNRGGVNRRGQGKGRVANGGASCGAANR